MEVISKKCQFQGCNEAVPQWAMYCQTHLDHVRRMQQPQMPPTIPAQAQPQPQRAMQMPQEPIPFRQTQGNQPIVQEQPQVRYNQPQYNISPQRSQNVPPQEENGEEEQEYPEEEEQEEQPPLLKSNARKVKSSKPRFPIPKVDDNMRLELRKASMQSAVGIIVSSQEMMDMPYEELIENIRTLTNELYRIIIEKAE